MKAVIMAGGSGTRLWPVSRKKVPKQVQLFGDTSTMLERTYRRLRRSWADRDIYVTTSAGQLSVVRKQLSKLKLDHFLAEPTRRDTAAAVGLISMYLWKKNPQEYMFTASSDHYFRQEDRYIKAIQAGGRFLHGQPDRTLLFGVKPSYPHTGLGYIKMKHQIGRVGTNDIYSVERFIEKPDLATAKKFVTGWEYLWNIGAFTFRVDAMLGKFKRWLPKSYALLMTMSKAVGTSREKATIRRLFPRMDKISIDYGVMEHDKNMFVMPLDLTWADIGGWREVYDMLASGAGKNIVMGRHVSVDSQNNLLFSYSGKLIATAGLKNMIVIEMDDVLLVCPMDRAQDVKKLVAELESKKLDQYL